MAAFPPAPLLISPAEGCQGALQSLPHHSAAQTEITECALLQNALCARLCAGKQIHSLGGRDWLGASLYLGAGVKRVLRRNERQPGAAAGPAGFSSPDTALPICSPSTAKILQDPSLDG